MTTDAGQPSVNQSTDSSGSIRAWSRPKQLLLGCGALLGACIVLTLAIALVTAVTDGDDDDVAATSTPRSAEASSVTPTETDSDSEPSATTAGGEATPTGAESEVTPTEAPTIELTATAEPTSTPEPTVAPSPTPIPAGRGRSNPMPYGEVGQTPDGAWDVQVLEVVRGDEAWNRIIAANQFNSLPTAGFEYVLVNVRVAYRGTEAEAQPVGFSDFNMTGDARVRWSWASLVLPEPELEGELFTDGEASGWVAFSVRSGEQNLTLIFEPLFSLEEGDEIFLAAQDGANVPVLIERLAEENDLGSHRQTPAPLGEHMVTDTWEIWVNEAVRGEEALVRIKETNQFNEDPPPGMEYMLVNLTARNVKPDSGSDAISSFLNFSSVGANNAVYDAPSVVVPAPELDYSVYAGGEVSGWIVIDIGVGEASPTLVFEPAYFSEDPRYLALE